MQIATNFARHNLTAPIVEARNGYIPLDVLRQRVPSAFATAKHDSRSARYTYLPTADIITGMMQEGFFPVSAMQSRARDEGKREHTKHMIRFRRDSDQQAVALATTRENHIINRGAPLAEFPEIVLVNSHDGSSSYRLSAGIFRLVCRNGLIVAGESIAEVAVQHTGNILDHVVNSAHELMRRLPTAMESIARWKA